MTERTGEVIAKGILENEANPQPLRHVASVYLRTITRGDLTVEEIRALQQSASDEWFNGLARHFGEYSVHGVQKQIELCARDFHEQQMFSEAATPGC